MLILTRVRLNDCRLMNLRWPIESLAAFAAIVLGLASSGSLFNF
jgi:hypothetical protein